jgi:hypothetical protein
MRRTTTATLLAAACLLLAAATTGCSKSYDEIAEDCVAALKDRKPGDESKPDACEGLKKDDYDALVISHVLRDELGWIDEDGNVDKNKMLEDALEEE